MPRFYAASLCVAFAGLLTLASYTGHWFVIAVVGFMQALLILAPHPVDDHGRIIAAPIVAAPAASAVVALALTAHPRWLTGADGTIAGSVGLFSTGSYAALIPAVAAGLVVALVSQMFRRDDRRQLVVSTGYAATLCVLAALPVGWASGAVSFGGVHAVAVCAAAVAGAVLAWQAPIDRWLCAPLSMAVGAGSSALVCALVSPTLTAYFGVTVGMFVALGTVIGLVIGEYWAHGRRHASAGWGFPGALALTFAAPFVHLAGQLTTAL